MCLASFQITVFYPNNKMTLVAAWVRKIKGVEELLVASDSRLRFGCAWDYCPKVFPLPRGDSVLCFAGDTFYAYPMLMQLRSAISMNHKLATRAVDVTDMRSYIVDLIDDMRTQVYDYPAGMQEEDKTGYRFIFAGYSWKFQEFRIWEIQYQKNIKRFSFRSVGVYPKEQNSGRIFHFIGDETGKARERLNRLLLSKSDLSHGELDMEPFEVLVGMVRDKVDIAIGGPPQLAKVYRHMNAMPYNVYWPTREEGRITFFGRPLLTYERNSYLVLDPDTLETIEPGVAFRNQ